MKSSTYGLGLTFLCTTIKVKSQIANCLRRFIKAPLPNGFVTLAWNARVVYSADKTVTHLCYKDKDKEKYFTFVKNSQTKSPGVLVCLSWGEEPVQWRHVLLWWSVKLAVYFWSKYFKFCLWVLPGKWQPWEEVKAVRANRDKWRDVLSHFLITLVSLCNKKAVALCNRLEMGGQRTSKPNNKYHRRQQQQQYRVYKWEPLFHFHVNSSN